MIVRFNHLLTVSIQIINDKLVDQKPHAAWKDVCIYKLSEMKQSGCCITRGNESLQAEEEHPVHRNMSEQEGHS